MLGIGGKIERENKTGKLKRIIANRAASLLPGLLTALRDLICSQHIVIILDVAQVCLICKKSQRWVWGFSEILFIARQLCEALRSSLAA